MPEVVEVGVHRGVEQAQLVVVEPQLVGAPSGSSSSRATMNAAYHVGQSVVGLAALGSYASWALSATRSSVRKRSSVTSPSSPPSL